MMRGAGPDEPEDLVEALARAQRQLAALEVLEVPPAERAAMPGLIRSSRALMKLAEKALAHHLAEKAKSASKPAAN